MQISILFTIQLSSFWRFPEQQRIRCKINGMKMEYIFTDGASRWSIISMKFELIQVFLLHESTLLIIFLLMHRNSTINQHPFRWENYDTLPLSGSLIVVPSPHSPKNYNNQIKPKFDDLGFKHAEFQRHESEKAFKRMENLRPSQFPLPPQQPLEQNHSRPPIEKARNSQIFSKRGSNSKTGDKPPLFPMARGSGGKVNNALKETSSTTNTEGLNTYKSERTFPSFLRNQTKSPTKPKFPKQGLCKQNFKVIRRLGQGKFGSVYLAKEIWTGMIVGLKVIEKKRIIRDNFLVQFIRQLKIQSFLDHPNIIKVYGHFSDEDNFYIILELGCDGQLFDVISGGQTLSEETTSFIIGNLLDAVGLMHKHKILHRDIKPQNIVLVHGNIKLCDFGWAVNKKEELRNTFCGTPLYLSPELMQGSRYDQKVDLWAIGVLSFELYFGSSPFDINEQQDLSKIVTEEIKFPTSKKISKQFKQFLEAILKKNPKQRMQSSQLVNLQFIKKYRELQTCEQLCH